MGETRLIINLFVFVSIFDYDVFEYRFMYENHFWDVIHL